MNNSAQIPIFNLEESGIVRFDMFLINQSKTKTGTLIEVFDQNSNARDNTHGSKSFGPPFSA